MRGFYKVQEEMGELGQALGKLGAFPTGNHPDGGENLVFRIEDEIADLYAALDYLVANNDLDRAKIERRRTHKRELFEQWGLARLG